VATKNATFGSDFLKQPVGSEVEMGVRHSDDMAISLINFYSFKKGN
jgi:hypothetical protein